MDRATPASARATPTAVGNLRPGAVTLTLTAFIAPDNVGTYEITLAEGLTFSDRVDMRRRAAGVRHRRDGAEARYAPSSPVTYWP